MDQHYPPLFITLSAALGSLISVQKILSSSCSFKKGDFVPLYQTLAKTDWSFLVQLNDVDLTLVKFNDNFYQLIETFIPHYTTWYNSDIV